MPTSDQQFCYLQLHLQRLPRLIHSVGWELLVKADSVVSSIMPRVPNSPHRGNLSLISPACLAAFTGQVVRSAISEVTSLRISRAGGRRNHLAKEMPFALKPGSSYHTRDQVYSIYGVMQMCVFGVSVFCKSLWKTIKLSVSTSRSLHCSFPVCGLSTSSKVTLSVWRASHPHMTPSSSRDWEHLRYAWFREAYMKSQKLY